MPTKQLDLAPFEGCGKTLIVYYSRTGITKQVAEHLHQSLVARGVDCTILGINPIEDFSGVSGYAKLSYRAVRQTDSDVADNHGVMQDEYDTVAIGGPVHFWRVNSPLKTWLTMHKDTLIGKGGRNFHFFATMGSDGDVPMFADMSELLGVKCKSSFSVLTKQCKEFCEKEKKEEKKEKEEKETK
eukprot:TRINITY_DN10268_c0_g1_i1.p1 TRINITY_DN10268_c0_g1~~TRINITY_DN10268_c0_g1_i1.p1  ORF type:complete len:185 (-),score=60.58 TRINITY_DN10268_c0_g1_i1:54-608(-)